MTQFDLWIKACVEFNTVVYLLDGNHDHALYSTWNKFEDGSRTTPVIQVWIHGKRELVTTNFREANMYWERRKNATTSKGLDIK